MRIKIKFSHNISPVPIDTHLLVNKFIHRCLGNDNVYHDTPSDYSISLLCGGKLIKGTKFLNFTSGAYLIVSTIDKVFLNQLIGGLSNDEMGLGYGMYFSGIDFIRENFSNGYNYFRTLSPILIKRKSLKGEKKQFITLMDEDFVSSLEEQTIKKLSKISAKYDLHLDLENFKIEIPIHTTHKIKKFAMKSGCVHVNVCHINIHTNKKVAEIIYNVGLGQSTGSGFGSIFKTESKDFYKF